MRSRAGDSPARIARPAAGLLALALLLYAAPREIGAAATGAGIEPPAGRYVVRAADSYVGYRIVKWRIVPVRGRFAEVRGAIRFDPEHPERSRVDVRVPVASLESGDPARTETLLSDDFFAAESFPEMRFVSERVGRGPDGDWSVSGRLTIRGVTRPVKVAVEVHAPEDGGPEVAVFSTRLQIDRRDFEVLGTRWSGGRAILAHDVDLELVLTARAEGAV